jgi:hypothetical protein
MINLKNKDMICKVIILAVLMMRLGISLAWHNQTRQDKYNFWWTLVSTTISVMLLYGAGLFD